DALRMMRAVRFAAVLDFSIEAKTGKAIKSNANLLSFISKERIRDEFVKIVMADKASEGIEFLRELGLLKYIMPELEEGYKVGQNKHHIYDCWEHSLKSLDYAASKKFNMHVRIAALMHDIAKPRVKAGDGSDSTFYNHEIVGAKMTKEILERLKFSKKDAEKIIRLVRYHLFYYNVGEVKEASVRRLVKNVGIENMEELLEVRQSDRIGSGVPKAEPYKLRHLKYLIEKVLQDPISAKALEINGNDIIKILNIKPGRKIGWILEILLADILANPKGNKKELLFERAKELGKLSDSELSEKAKKAQNEISQVETKKDKMTKDKYWVV
ncbi:MAG: HD domain-containing protein, partial [Candidatus Nealsonbacteria bacterium]|nr:HD domain-containing protein [Candidatus Nealsonbacteria bacterium]